ncbi:MAG TPA: flagellar biosynthetic protein FliO [Alphaproteobacteria bacterium]|nr:flagellar biosynthetic protein FliO [Alphaproteobacteria bacterium]
MPDSEILLKFISAFALVMGMMFLLSWGLKRMGLAGHSLLPSGKRRLKIVEVLPIDHRRRLVLVRRDDKEHLLVLGTNGETVVESNIAAITDTIVDLPPSCATEKETKHA